MARLLELLVRVYRNSVGLVLPNSCRYQPTCSQYALDALAEHGAVEGVWLTLKRIARCHPFCPGGHDPVPPKGPMTKDDGQALDFTPERRATTG